MLYKAFTNKIERIENKSRSHLEYVSNMGLKTCFPQDLIGAALRISNGKLKKPCRLGPKKKDSVEMDTLEEVSVSGSSEYVSLLAGRAHIKDDE